MNEFNIVALIVAIYWFCLGFYGFYNLKKSEYKLKKLNFISIKERRKYIIK